MLPPRAAGSRRRPEAGARALDHGGAARNRSREIASLSARLTRGHSAAATINAKRRQFYYRCHRKRAGSGASVKRSLTAEKQYHQPTRGSWSGLQAVRGSEACIPEMQDCGAPDRSRLQRNDFSTLGVAVSAAARRVVSFLCRGERDGTDHYRFSAEQQSRRRLPNLAQMRAPGSGPRCARPGTSAGVSSAPRLTFAFAGGSSAWGQTHHARLRERANLVSKGSKMWRSASPRYSSSTPTSFTSFFAR